MAAERYDDVLAQLGRAIAAGDLAAGHRLVLSDIEAEHGVSRTVARDAVKVLASLGLVTSRRRAGIEVQPRSAWQVLDPQVIAWRLDADREGVIRSLTELREAIEPRAARLAATHATREQALALREQAQVMERLGRMGAGQSPAFLAADLIFHSVLVEASGNEHLAALEGVVREVLRGRHDFGLTPAWPDEGALAAHLQVAEGILARDAGAAEAASLAQMEQVIREVTPASAS